MEAGAEGGSTQERDGCVSRTWKNLITAESKGVLQVGVSIQEFLEPKGGASQAFNRTVMARDEDMSNVEKPKPQ